MHEFIRKIFLAKNTLYVVLTKLRNYFARAFHLCQYIFSYGYGQNLALFLWKITYLKFQVHIILEVLPGLLPYYNGADILAYDPKKEKNMILTCVWNDSNTISRVKVSNNFFINLVHIVENEMVFILAYRGIMHSLSYLGS